MLALLRIGRGKSLNHQDHAINEWRTEASGQFLRNPTRFAPFDASCGLQMALGMKGKWEERKHGGHNDSSQPEMAHTDKVHSIRLNRYVNEFAYRAGWGLTFRSRFIRSLWFRSSPGTDRFAFRTGSYYFNVW